MKKKATLLLALMALGFGSGLKAQGDYYVARSEYDSPEVDQEILIPAEQRQLRRGHFYDVRITGAEGYDLYGEVIAPSRKRRS